MKKLSVILADDDKLVLQDLKSLVKWDSLGFQIVASASDGATALNYVNKYIPDLLITDIEMPGINGLDLIDTVHHNYPKMKILIITSYDEFGYIKRALQNSVVDYILKTEITAASLSQKLIDICNSCENENQTVANILTQELTHYFQNEAETLNEAVLPDICRYPNTPWHFGIITWNQTFTREYNRTADGFSFYTSQLKKQIQQFSLNQWITPYYFYHGCYVFYAFPLNGTKKNGQNDFIKFGTKLHHWLTSKTGKNFVHYYTSNGMTLTDFRALFFDVKPLLHYYTIFCPDRPSEIKTLTKQHVILSDAAFPFQKLIFEPDQMENNIMLFKQYVTKCCENYDIESILQLYCGFCTFIETTTNGRMSFKNDLYAPTPEVFLKWLFNTCEQCCQTLKHGSSRQYSAPVEAAISYINQNYSDDRLTAEIISSEVGLSQGRLGVLFKQDTGKTLKEYLTDLRIQKAIHFLQNTNMKIYEISAKCGYHSSQYFSQIIYQYTGKRPLDFRRAEKSPSQEMEDTL